MASVTTRRRGKTLEGAIHAAVLAELADVGYGRLTFDGVAARAGTSKPVLYRRWSSRPEMVLAALAGTMPTADEMPDTGDVRSDLIALLSWLRRRLADGVGREAICGLVAETIHRPEVAATLNDQLLHPAQRLIMPVLQRAVDRGEIAADRLTPRIVRLPLDLLRHDYLIHGSTGDADIVTVVDEIFLPLVRT